MRVPIILIIVLLIPAFVALGHDIYLFYTNEAQSGMLNLDLIKEKFKFSALGFIWTNYYPDGYKTVASGLDSETWKIVDQFLGFKAFFAGLSFAGAIVGLMIFFALFGLGPMASDGGRIYGGKEKTPPKIGGKKSGSMDYKRK